MSGRGAFFSVPQCSCYCSMRCKREDRGSLLLLAFFAASLFLPHSSSFSTVPLPKIPILRSSTCSPVRCIPPTAEHMFDGMKRFAFLRFADKFRPAKESALTQLNINEFSFASALTTREPAAYCSAEPGRVGGVEKQNQDAVIIANPLHAGISMFAVLDGHGVYGKQVSEWVVNTLPTAVKNSFYSSEGTDGLAKRMQDVFKYVDSEVSSSLGDAVCESGCTATVVLQKGNLLMTAFLGDSKAVIGGKGKHRELTAHHNPASPAERERIEKEGGVVGVLPGEAPLETSGKGRVFVAGRQSPALATARAFGDTIGKTVGVSANPELNCYSLSPSDKILILATDGVWDVMDPDAAVETCMQYAGDRDADMAATVLVQACRMLWEQREGSAQTIDDISAVVVFL